MFSSFFLPSALQFLLLFSAQLSCIEKIRDGLSTLQTKQNTHIAFSCAWILISCFSCVYLSVCACMCPKFSPEQHGQRACFCAQMCLASLWSVCVCLVCLIGLVSPLYRRVVDSIFNNVRQTIRSAFRFHRHLCLFVFMFLKLNFISTFSHYLLLMNVPLQSSIPLPF